MAAKARRKPLDRLRALCLAMPDAHEVEAWGEPTFRVRDKIFVMHASADTHHGAGRAAAWCKSTAFTQDLLLRDDPARYFRPPYVGPRGWVGVYLDDRPDWTAVDALARDAWRLTAPKRLLPLLDDD